MGERVIFIGTYNYGKHPGMPAFDYRPDYTPQEVQRSRGIYALKLNSLTGELSKAEFVAEALNSSYISVDHSRRHLYAVGELLQDSTVTSFSIDHTSSFPKLNKIGEVNAVGALPCHISFDKKGEVIFVSKYLGDTVSLFPIQPNGALSPASSTVTFSGSGPDASRQEKPHPHSASLDPLENKYCFVTDLGTDSIDVFAYDGTKYALSDSPLAKVKVAPGSGPRLLAWHPSGKFAYVINELNATVYAYSYEGAGRLNEIQQLDASPPSYAGRRWASEIQVHPSGKWLYVANRIADSLTIFSIDDSGRLTITGHQPTHGKTPRQFAIDPSGQFLVVANQHADNLASFKIDQTNGLLQLVSTTEVPSPSCAVIL